MAHGLSRLATPAQTEARTPAFGATTPIERMTGRAELVYLHIVALGGAPARLQGALRTLANWSMLDVVLVAIVIFAAKTSGLATAITQSGLWFFTASVVLTALASALAARLHGKTPGSR